MKKCSSLISLILCLILLLSSCGSYDTKDGNFVKAKPSSVGIKQEYIDDTLNAFKNTGEFATRLDSLLILRKGKLVCEEYFGDYDENTLHSMFSVSKSFTSAAVGFAADEGKIKLEDKAISYFDDIKFDNSEGKIQLQYRDSATIKDLLTMSSGHNKETLDLMFNKTTLNEAIKAYFDECPYTSEPGTSFFYDNGTVFVLSAIVQKVTGKTVLEYLNEKLFGKLGIEGIKWGEIFGVTLGYSGLEIKPMDMLKFGKFIMNKGTWNGEQLLSSEYITEATKYQVNNEQNVPDENNDWKQGYGYLFWQNRLENSFRCDGAYGQLIVMIPDKDMVIVVTEEAEDFQTVMNILYDNLINKIK